MAGEHIGTEPRPYIPLPAELVPTAPEPETPLRQRLMNLAGNVSPSSFGAVAALSGVVAGFGHLPHQEASLAAVATADPALSAASPDRIQATAPKIINVRTHEMHAGDTFWGIENDDDLPHGLLQEFDPEHFAPTDVPVGAKIIEPAHVEATAAEEHVPNEVAAFNIMFDAKGGHTWSYQQDQNMPRRGNGALLYNHESRSYYTAAIDEIRADESGRQYLTLVVTETGQRLVVPINSPRILEFASLSPAPSSVARPASPHAEASPADTPSMAHSRASTSPTRPGPSDSGRRAPNMSDPASLAPAPASSATISPKVTPSPRPEAVPTSQGSSVDAEAARLNVDFERAKDAARVTSADTETPAKYGTADVALTGYSSEISGSASATRADQAAAEAATSLDVGFQSGGSEQTLSSQSDQAPRNPEGAASQEWATREKIVAVAKELFDQYGGQPEPAVVIKFSNHPAEFWCDDLRNYILTQAGAPTFSGAALGYPNNDDPRVSGANSTVEYATEDHQLWPFTQGGRLPLIGDAVIYGKPGYHIETVIGIQGSVITTIGGDTLPAAADGELAMREHTIDLSTDPGDISAFVSVFPKSSTANESATPESSQVAAALDLGFSTVTTAARSTGHHEGVPTKESATVDLNWSSTGNGSSSAPSSPETGVSGEFKNDTWESGDKGPYSVQAFSSNVLQALAVKLGIPSSDTVTREHLIAIAAWAYAEKGNMSPDNHYVWNLLNTGVNDSNLVAGSNNASGLQSFKSFNDGIAAVIETLTVTGSWQSRIAQVLRDPHSTADQVMTTIANWQAYPGNKGWASLPSAQYLQLLQARLAQTRANYSVVASIQIGPGQFGQNHISVPPLSTVLNSGRTASAQSSPTAIPNHSASHTNGAVSSPTLAPSTLPEPGTPISPAPAPDVRPSSQTPSGAPLGSESAVPGNSSVPISIPGQRK